MSYNWNHPGEDLDKGYVEMIKSITPEEIQEMACQISQGDRILVVMTSPQNTDAI